MSRTDANVGDRGRAGGRTGRKLGIGLFWLLAVYMIGMSAASIIPSLYFPDAAPRPAASSLEGCAGEIAALQRDLLDVAADTVRSGELAGLERRLLRWDQRSLALAGGCGPLEGARRDLLTLRAGIGALLADHRSGPLRVQQRLQRALDALDAGERPKT